jgi:uncharacterized protein
MRHIMLLPSLNCPANCMYCFGPHQGGKTMTLETLSAFVDWQQALGENEPLEITFHGGEPLIAGLEFYQAALPLLHDHLSPRKVSFGIQSNLWLLNDSFCDLFREYQVAIGTSLDGPEGINDAQRGRGYFQRTWEGMERARAHGMSTGCICTFTAQSAPHAGEIFDFFLKQGLGFSLHAALPALGKAGSEVLFRNGWSLAPAAHSDLLVDMLERYLENCNRIRISTLDSLCRSISAGKGSICTFTDCLGSYLAVDPQGWIYACQRLAGMPRFRLGNVHERPSWENLQASPAWQMFQQRQERVADECGDCAHINYCRGGCPYNVLVSNGGNLDHALRDPHCPAYKSTFETITERALAEVFSESNLAQVIAEGPGKYGLLRKGKLLQIMRGGAHPQEVSQQSRRVVAAVALACSGQLEDSETIEKAIEKLDQVGIVTDRNLARYSLESLQSQLLHQADGWVNAYIHVTDGCNLTCDHCYAISSPTNRQVMSIENIVQLVRQVAQAGFHKAVITGGESLVHPQRTALLDSLAELRPTVKPLTIVLRTNLVGALPEGMLEKIAGSADQIVVSLDGTESTHDTRRGMGAYARTLKNLRQLVQLKDHPEISLAATLSADQIEAADGQSVRALAKELGVGLRFKPVLPLGRAVGKPLAPEFYSSLDEDGKELVSQARLLRTCGLGMNLYIAPNGECFPCYALMGERHRLGNIFTGGLEAVLSRNDSYRQVTVDSNKKCDKCALRYLCGGFCRAWGDSNDADAPPRDCSALQERARKILISALEALDIPVERWIEAGLPTIC